MGSNAGNNHAIRSNVTDIYDVRFALDRSSKSKFSESQGSRRHQQSLADFKPHKPPPTKVCLNVSKSKKNSKVEKQDSEPTKTDKQREFDPVSYLFNVDMKGLQESPAHRKRVNAILESSCVAEAMRDWNGRPEMINPPTQSVNILNMNVDGDLNQLVQPRKPCNAGRNADTMEVPWGTLADLAPGNRGLQRKTKKLTDNISNSANYEFEKTMSCKPAYQMSAPPFATDAKIYDQK